MSDHYVRTYDPATDSEEWIGPLSLHMAGVVAEGLEGKRQTRVYHRSELPAVVVGVETAEERN